MLLKFQLKFEFLESLKPEMDSDSLLKGKHVSLKFCGKNVAPPKAEPDLLPVLIHSCPDDFSTVDYYDVSNN